MGLVTAFYAVGATLAPILFRHLITVGGNPFALRSMSMVVLLVALVSAFVIYKTRPSFISETAATVKCWSPSFVRIRRTLWLAYGCAVCAGLMLIGHAYSIAIWLNFDLSTATWSTTLIAFCNMLGGFSAGYLADRWSSQGLLRWLPLLSVVGLLLLVIPLSSWSVIAFLGFGFVGYSYGALIAVYPVAVVDTFGTIAATRVYGQVFTAWGLAGFIGPWFTGWLYDITGTYTVAIITAMLLSAASTATVYRQLDIPGSISS